MKKLPLLLLGSWTVLAPLTARSDQIRGQVLPFAVFDAFRNYGFKDSMVAAHVSVGVVGGTPSDWAATAAYIAKHSLIKGATFAQVEVLTLTPWGDRPPLKLKALATAYYSPDPGKGPWKEPFDVLVATKQASLPEIEWFELADALIGKFSPESDPDKAVRNADRKALQLVISKYHLPRSWTPPETIFFGIGGPALNGADVDSIVSADTEKFMDPLLDCLASDKGNAVFRGCLYDASAYADPLAEIPDRSQGLAKSSNSVHRPAAQ